MSSVLIRTLLFITSVLREKSENVVNNVQSGVDKLKKCNEPAPRRYSNIHEQ